MLPWERSLRDESNHSALALVSMMNQFCYHRL
jgi:hypothetical protein